MDSGLIPHRYALALYKYAEESKSCAAVYAEMNNVIGAFRADSRLEKILSNPFVEAADKKKVLLAAAGKNPGNDFNRFVTLIIDHHREEFAYLMAIAYRDIYRKKNHIAEVTITTAASLPDSEINKLKSVVGNAFKGMSFEYVCKVDPSIIGGFVIDVDSTRMDASISSELEQLRQNLTTN